MVNGQDSGFPIAATPNARHPYEPPTRRIMSDHPVLVCSEDQVGAALLGALVETLGYRVAFSAVPTQSELQMRRERPRVALVDGKDDAHCSDSFLGRARMRGVSVTVYGSAETIARIRTLVEAHGLGMLLMPAETKGLAEMLEAAYA